MPQVHSIVWRITEARPRRLRPARTVVPAGFAAQHLATWLASQGAQATARPAADRASDTIHVSSTLGQFAQIMRRLPAALWTQKHRADLQILASNAAAREGVQRFIARLDRSHASLPDVAICRHMMWRRHRGSLQLLHFCTDEMFAAPWPRGATGSEIVAAIARDTGLRHGRDADSYMQTRLRNAVRAARATIPLWRKTASFSRIGIMSKTIWQRHLDASMAAPWQACVRDPAYYLSSSSGTTGTPQTVVYERAVNEARTAAEQSRWARPAPPRFVVLNRTANVFSRQAPPDRFAVRREGKHKLMVSPGDNPTTVPAATWARVRARVARYQATSVAADAQYLIGMSEGRGFSPPTSLREVILATNASWQFQRELIATRFGVTPRVLYHAGETGAIAISCARGAWHLLETHAYYEIITRGRAAQPGETGLLLVTTLDTKIRPLFRYPIGDLVHWPRQACACGTSGRTVVLDGRMARVIQDGRGNWVLPSMLDGLLAEVEGVSFLRAIRDDAGLTLEYIGKREVSLPTRRLAAAFGLHVATRRVESMPLDAPHGKLALISAPDPSERLFASFTDAKAPAIRLVPWH